MVAPVLTDGVSSFTPGISARTSGATKFQHDDRLGTLGLETDSSQTTTATKTYDAFGMPISTSGSSASPFGFSGGYGYQEDQDSGLKLLGHRYYDPSTGRFLTRDKAKDGRNWYGYCANNPLKYVDAEGLAYVIVEIDHGGKGHGSHARIGIWDGVPGHPIEWFGFYQDGVRYNDAPTPGMDNSTACIWIDDATYKRIRGILVKRYYDSKAGRHKKWKASSYNCAQWIWEILNEAGIINDDGMPMDPIQLFEELTSQWGWGQSPPVDWGWKDWPWHRIPAPNEPKRKKKSCC